ncbi:MAG: O-antigen ligase family protein [bacterium]|nr:O-antigen ligase family protein [bacterium]
MFHIFFISGMFLSLISIYVIIDSGFNFKLRLSSVWDHYNLFAAYIMIIFFFNLCFIVYSKKDSNRKFYIVSLIVNFMGLFLTQTRGVWIATIIGLSIFILRKPKYILPIGIVAILLLAAFSDVIMERAATVINFKTDISTLGRVQAWLASYLLIKENLLVGYGYDAFRDLMNSVIPVYFVVVTHSHNTYLLILLEFGLIGFILFFSFYFKALYYSFKLRKNSEPIMFKYIYGLQLSFIAMIVAFIFEPYFTTLGAINYVLWILIALSYSLWYKQIKT